MFCIKCGSVNPEYGKYCHKCGQLLFRPKAEETLLPVEPSIRKWQHALDEYRYPVDLTTFADRQQHCGWFARNIDVGNRAQTIEFETFFRQNAPDHLEAWLEVVFWKLYSSHPHIAKVVIETVKRNGVSAGELWSKCYDFTEHPSRSQFALFQELLVTTPTIAVCATFPAFIAPDRFPMVDSQIAKWVMNNHEKHNRSSNDGVDLKPPKTFITKKGKADILLNLSQYQFVESWTLWCRSKAKRLTEVGQQQWRPRDVEMAIFTAQRGNLELPTIP